MSSHQECYVKVQRPTDRDTGWKLWLVWNFLSVTRAWVDPRLGWPHGNMRQLVEMLARVTVVQPNLSGAVSRKNFEQITKFSLCSAALSSQSFGFRNELKKPHNRSGLFLWIPTGESWRTNSNRETLVHDYRVGPPTKSAVKLQEVGIMKLQEATNPRPTWIACSVFSAKVTDLPWSLCAWDRVCKVGFEKHDS